MQNHKGNYGGSFNTQKSTHWFQNPYYWFISEHFWASFTKPNNLFQGYWQFDILHHYGHARNDWPHPIKISWSKCSYNEYLITCMPNVNFLPRIVFDILKFKKCKTKKSHRWINFFFQNLYCQFTSAHLGHAWLNPKKITWSSYKFHENLARFTKRNFIPQIFFVILKLKKVCHLIGRDHFRL